MKKVVLFGFSILFAWLNAEAVALNWSIPSDKMGDTGIAFSNIDTVIIFTATNHSDHNAAVDFSPYTSKDAILNVASGVYQKPEGGEGAGWSSTAISARTTGLATAQAYYIVAFSGNNYVASRWLSDSDSSYNTNRFFDDQGEIAPPDPVTWTPDALNAGWFTTGTVVPEPTSLALLALGIAGIGLRRRVK